MRDFPTKSTGDEFTSSEFNDLVNEPENLVTSSGQTLDSGNANQLGIASAIYAAGGDYYTDSGTANNYVLSPVGSKQAPDAYFDGMKVVFKPTNASNATTNTVNVNSLGVKNITKANGSAIVAGYFQNNNYYVLVYNATSGEFNTVWSSNYFSDFHGKNVTVHNGTSFTSESALIKNSSAASTNSVVTIPYTGTTDQFVLRGSNEAVKGWVTYIGNTSVISDSYNVASVNKNGTGDYTINWDKDLGNTGYAVLTSFQNPGNDFTIAVTSASAGSTRVKVENLAGTSYDLIVYVLVIGDQ